MFYFFESIYKTVLKILIFKMAANRKHFRINLQLFGLMCDINRNWQDKI